jgi:hypothetical protein
MDDLPALDHLCRARFREPVCEIMRRSPVVRHRRRSNPVSTGAGRLGRAAFVKALSEPRAIAQTYDLCGAETLSLDEIVDDILAVMNRTRLKVHIPFLVAHAQAAFMEFVFRRLLFRLRKAPPLTCDQILMLQEDNIGTDGLRRSCLGRRRGVSWMELRYLMRDA